MRGQLGQLRDDVGDLVAELHAAHLPEVQRDEIDCNELGEKRFGGSDSDLGASMRVQHCVGFAWDRRSHRVTDSEHRRAHLVGVLHCHQRVERLSGLGDRDDEALRVENRVAVTEFAGQLDFTRQPGPVFDDVLGDQAGVECTAASNDNDLVDVAQQCFVEAHLIEHQCTAVGQPTEQRGSYCVGLFGDLLQHKRAVAALLGS